LSWWHVSFFFSFLAPSLFQWPVDCHKKKVKWRKDNDTCWITWSRLLCCCWDFFPFFFFCCKQLVNVSLYFRLCHCRKLEVSLARKARSSNVFERRYVSIRSWRRLYK
jgi:hypothetical protein